MQLAGGAGLQSSAVFASVSIAIAVHVTEAGGMCTLTPPVTVKTACLKVAVPGFGNVTLAVFGFPQLMSTVAACGPAAWTFTGGLAALCPSADMTRVCGPIAFTAVALGVFRRR